MPIQQRLLLIMGAIFVFFFVTDKVKKKKILMGDAIYWVVLSAILVFVGIMPELVIAVSAWLGFMSPSNFVFLVVVALLLIKSFSSAAQISLLTHKVEELAQEIALNEERHAREHAHNDERQDA